jgi:predicted membrane protein DUF2207
LNDDLFGQLDLGGAEPLVVVAGVIGCLLWLAAASFVYALRSPPRPPVGPLTLDLGPEPPAIANFLVNDFRVTDEAVPATLLDLAARRIVEIEERGPDVFYVRLQRSRSTEALTPYERRVLEHLERLASDSAVPAHALTTGPELESKAWWTAFRSEVVWDAKARGLSRDALDSFVFAVLIAVAAIPAACFWAVWGVWVAAAVVAGAAVVLAWVRARFPQRETPAGMAAASRWLGVRAELAANEALETRSPLEVALWDRLLAYAAALGAASAAASPLPLGVESDTRAWSAYGGSWREIRIRYPRLWPPAWGKEPLAALPVGIAVAALGAIVLYWLGPSLLDAGGSGAAFLLVGAGLVLVGVAVAVMAGRDRTTIEFTGPVVRLRALGDDDELRYYAAVDDGFSPVIRALRVTERQYARLRQGQLVTVRATPILGHVRAIEPEGSERVVDL